MCRSPANNLSMSALRSQTACGGSLLVCASFIILIELFVSFMAFGWHPTLTRDCAVSHHQMSCRHASRFHVARTRHSSVVLALLPVAAANSSACLAITLTWLGSHQLGHPRPPSSGQPLTGSKQAPGVAGRPSSDSGDTWERYFEYGAANGGHTPLWPCQRSMTVPVADFLIWGTVIWLSISWNGIILRTKFFSHLTVNW